MEAVVRERSVVAELAIWKPKGHLGFEGVM